MTAPWLCEIVFKSPEPDAPAIRITTNVHRVHKGKGYKIYVRDPSVSRQLWPNKFVDDIQKGNPDADDLAIVKLRPSEVKLDPKNQHQPNRIQEMHPVCYKEIVKSKMNYKKNDFFSESELDEVLLTFTNKCTRNLMRLFFNNVVLQTFNKQSDISQQDLAVLKETLKSYRVYKVVLGLPAIRKCEENREAFSALLTQHDRAVKASCELGLHLQRVNEER